MGGLCLLCGENFCCCLGFGNGDDEVHLQMTRLDLLIEEQVNEVTDNNIAHVVEMFQPAGKYNIVVKHETKG